MELQIRTNGTKVTDGMRGFIDRRIQKLDRLADKVVDAQLELRTETTRTGAELTTAQLTLHTRKHVIRAEAENAEATKAIDMAIDRLITQVRKYSDKRQTRRRKGTPTVAEMVTGTPEGLPEGLTPDGDRDAAAGDEVSIDEFADINPVARTKRFQMEPMDVEMAIEQMELVGHDFFFFRNQEDETFSVLYRRRDGSYGVLSPE